MTVQCCKCKRVRIQNRWLPTAPAAAGPVSHTYCPVCFEAVRVEIRRAKVLRVEGAPAA